MKKILISGAAGFIGSRLVESFNQQKKEIISVDDVRFFKVRKHLSLLKFGTIVDKSKLLIADPEIYSQLDAIIHMGAITDTQSVNEVAFQQWNLQYSQALWKICCKYQIPFIYASSAATYGNGLHGYDDRVDSLSQLLPLNKYAESKHRFDLWVLQQSHTPPFWCGLKFFNVYGFGENHKNHMASVIFQAYHQIKLNGTIKLFRSCHANIEDGHQKRDFVHVQDVIKVIHFILNNKLTGIYNVGTGHAKSFLELSSIVSQKCKKPLKIEWIDTPLPLKNHYQSFTEAKMEKLYQAGYPECFLSLEDGIYQTIDSIEAYYSML